MREYMAVFFLIWVPLSAGISWGVYYMLMHPENKALEVYLPLVIMFCLVVAYPLSGYLAFRKHRHGKDYQR